MAYPAGVSNGDVPDAAALMAWFNWLAGGRGIRKDAYANIKSAALSDAEYPFIAWATDLRQLVFYTGDAAIGDAGFIVIGGA